MSITSVIRNFLRGHDKEVDQALGKAVVRCSLSRVATALTRCAAYG